MTPLPGGARASRAAFLLSLVAVAGATLSEGSSATATGWCLICGEHGTADAIRNVLLFVPVGATALLATGSLPFAAAVGPALSAILETAQLAIPGRSGGPGDVMFNTLGSLSGVLIAATATTWLVPSRATAGRLASLAAAAALLVVWIAASVLKPDLPLTTYYGQWTPDLGHLDVYRGQVLGAAVGTISVPSGRLSDSQRIRASLLGGAPISVHAVAGPPPRRLAPIFSIFDQLRQEVLVLGARRADLTLRLRTRAAALRLETPELRLAGALSDIDAGQPLHVVASRIGSAWCVAVRYGGDPAREGLERCGIGYTIASGWQLVVPVGFAGFDPRVADALWLVALFAPTGFWIRRDPVPITALLAAGLGLVVVPAVTSLVPSPPYLLLFPAFGVFSGILSRRLVDRWRGPHGGESA